MTFRISRLWPLAVAFLLGASCALQVAGAALAEDETPDLVVEVVNAGGQVAELKVTNQSPNWADETTMVVQAIGQQQTSTLLTPHQHVQSFFIENLDPGQSTTVVFALPVPCIQHSLIVSVVPAGNWEDVKETNQANNVISVPLCVSTTASAPELHIPVDVSGGCPGCARQKPQAAPVNVDIPLETWISEVSHKNWLEPGAPPLMRVGFMQHEGGIATPTRTGIARLGIRFHREKLLTFKGMNITRATITYEERSSGGWWTSGSGSYQEKPGCVARVMIATAPVDSPSGLKYTFFANHDPGSRVIDVTGPTIDFINGRNSGFVLLGPFDKVDGDDDTSCMSELSNIVLHLTFQP